MTALLSYFLFTVQKLELENVFPRDIRNIRTVNRLTADYKYSLCNSENLQQPIQKDLSKKLKPCPKFSAPFVKFTSIFEHFEKKVAFIGFVFSKLRTTKDVVK